jgi:transposase
MFVGIDVAKDSLVACAMDDQGEDIFHSYSVENNRPGCLKLINLIADNANLLKPDIIKVGMEGTKVQMFSGNTATDSLKTMKS